MDAPARDSDSEPVPPPAVLIAQTSRHFVGMVQRCKDIMIVNMRYSSEGEGEIEVEAAISPGRTTKRPPSPVDPHPELGVEHSTVDIRLAVDAMLGQSTIPSTVTTIPRTDAAAMRPKGFARLGSRKPFPIARSKDDIAAEWCTRVFRHEGYLTADERVVGYLTATHARPVPCMQPSLRPCAPRPQPCAPSLRQACGSGVPRPR